MLTSQTALYLLAGMLQLRQVDRVEATLDDLKKTRPGDIEAKLLVALYGKALSDIKAADSGSIRPAE